MARPKRPTPPSTQNAKEIAHFQKDSHAWWDEGGPFAPLHRLNPVRMEFMVGVLEVAGMMAPRRMPGAPSVSRGPRVKPEGPERAVWNHLDVGCGGGLVAEPVARLGAQVTGVDADAQAIAVARAHARDMGLDITYVAGGIEDMKGAKATFDSITALEVIEHVDAPAVFVRELVMRVRPGGIIFMSTLNRTLKSLLLGKVVAEYVLGWVPPGTHDPGKFVKPSELTAMMSKVGCAPIAATGLCYHPIRRAFYADPHDLDVNYMMAFVKNKNPR
jgi:2-polyprenyl-6-hydroxyphenyl methylase/3-demethylubiquinone-9 3-methyltransferase